MRLLLHRSKLYLKAQSYIFTRPSRRYAFAVLCFGVFVFFTNLVMRRPEPSPTFSYPSPGPDFYQFSTSSNFTPVSITSANPTNTERCNSFPRSMLQLVQPVLKLGHSESRAKVEAQLETSCACFKDTDLLIFSDLSDNIGGIDVVDVLADLPESYRGHRDMQGYIIQKEESQRGVPLKEKTKIDGWAFDKYKFLPMIEKAYLTRPGKPFYFFLESDTYVFWDNVFRFLQNFDPDQPIYMGSPSRGLPDKAGGHITWFANGGPGFVLSRGAIKALLHREKRDGDEEFKTPHVLERWEKLLEEDCCGDSVTGWALWNAGVPLHGLWPMFQGHPLHGVPFGEDHWCQPVFSLHRTRLEEMKALWDWEFKHRQLEQPLTYSNLWDLYHEDIPYTKTNWNNGPWLGEDDHEVDVIPTDGQVLVTVDECARMCRDYVDCLQFNWRGGAGKECTLMKSFRYGIRRDPERGRILNWELAREVTFTSGWMLDRIEHWRKDRVCWEADWVGPSVERTFWVT